MASQINATSTEATATNSAQKPKKEEPSEWQTSCYKLSSRLGLMRSLGLWADCELAVGGAGVRVPAHRVLLASASPVLAAVLYGTMPTGESGEVNDNLPIPLPDIDPDIFNLVLEYIYTDNISVSSVDVACRLYRAAYFFVLPYLQAICKTYLINNVSSERVIDIYEFAEVFDENEIIEKCLEVMSKKTEEVLEGQGFERARPETLTKLFSLPSLNLCSELELFRAAERWVHARKSSAASNDQVNVADQGDANPVNKESQDNNNNTTDAKTSIRTAVKQIRFLTLHQEEFAEYDMTSLLSESEVLAISLRLITKKTYLKMPEGFSDSWEKRCLKTKYTIKVNLKDLLKDQLSVNIQPSCIPKFTWTLNLKRFNIRNKIKMNIEACPSELERMSEPWACLATIRIEILSHRKDATPYRWKVTHAFSRGHVKRSLCPPHFITLEELIDPENGYLYEDTVTFEVKIDAQPPVFGGTRVSTVEDRSKFF